MAVESAATDDKRYRSMVAIRWSSTTVVRCARRREPERSRHRAGHCDRKQARRCEPGLRRCRSPTTPSAPRTGRHHHSWNVRQHVRHTPYEVIAKPVVLIRNHLDETVDCSACSWERIHHYRPAAPQGRHADHVSLSVSPLRDESGRKSAREDRPRYHREHQERHCSRTRTFSNCSRQRSLHRVDLQLQHICSSADSHSDGGCGVRRFFYNVVAEQGQHSVYTFSCRHASV